MVVLASLFMVGHSDLYPEYRPLIPFLTRRRLFSLSGTGVTVYGTVVRPTPNLDFSLDGNNSTFTGPVGTALGKSTAVFQAEGLAPSQNHTLTMVVLSNDRWYLDYIVYRASSAPPSPTTTGPVASNVTGGPSSAPASSPPNVAAIVGGIIGGLAGLALLLFGLLWWQRRKQSRPTPEVDVQSAFRTDYATSTPASNAHPSLFAGRSSSIHKRGRDGLSGGRSPGVGHDDAVIDISATSPSMMTETVVTSDRVPESDPMQARGGPVARHIREVDAGVRLASGSDIGPGVVYVLPPSYSRFGQD